MKTRAHQVFFFFLLVVGSALVAGRAAGEASPPASSADSPRYSYSGKLIIPRPNTVYADSSEVLREHKTICAHLAFGLLAYEVAIGYYLNPLNILEAKYIRQKDYFSGIMNFTNISWLHFFADSMYGRIGWSWRWGMPSKLVSISDEKNQAPFSDFGIDLGVGNRWQWETLSLGVEWVGVYSPQVSRKQLQEPIVQLRALMVTAGVSL
jgi:hypothetical protein